MNCGAISPNLVESELFGHEKGAFTGAERRREGTFELARRGTLFLDEVTETPLEMQVKLLRVLETKSFRRVGGTEERDVDVRVVASSNRDVLEAVAAGTFREDLYYRLAVFPLRLPPLRERLSDVPLLAREFLVRIEAEERRDIDDIEPAALDALRRHAWPGNVRELRNVVHRAYVLSDPPAVSLEAAEAVLAAPAPLPPGAGGVGDGARRSRPRRRHGEGGGAEADRGDDRGRRRRQARRGRDARPLAEDGLQQAQVLGRVVAVPRSSASRLAGAGLTRWWSMPASTARALSSRPAQPERATRRVPSRAGSERRRRATS